PHHLDLHSFPTRRSSDLDLKGLALARTGDPAQRITDLLGELTKLIPADGLVALETFVTTVTTFEAAIPSDPAQIATFLGHGFLGDRKSTRLNSSHDQISY